MPARIIFSDIEIAEMARLYVDTKSSSRTISKLMGCSPQTVCAALRNAGVDINASLKLSQIKSGVPSGGKGIRHNISEDGMKSLRDRAIGNKWCAGRTHSAETLLKISAETKGKNVKFSPQEKKDRESVRQSSKRFIRRVLASTSTRKTIPSAQYLGYSNAQLSKHLGPRPDGAHIDHYVPIVEFIKRGITDVDVINALPNLRWLDGYANRKKSASVPSDADEIIDICLQQKSQREVLTAHFTPGGATTYSKGA